MTRREFITLLGGAATWPFVARAQQPGRPTIGFLHYGSPETYSHIVSAFRQGLRDSGFIEGQNVAIEYRWANGQYDRLPTLAADLVHHQAVAIAAAGFVGAQAAKAATTTIPVVFASGVDPVASGVVASLSRPGGNVTGVSLISLELAAKRLELLRELMPQIRVIALLTNPDNPSTVTELTDAEVAARKLGLQIRKVTASNERDLERGLRHDAGTAGRCADREPGWVLHSPARPNYRLGRPSCSTRGLLLARVSRCWWSDELRTQSRGGISPSRHLCWQDAQRRETRRSAG